MKRMTTCTQRLNFVFLLLKYPGFRLATVNIRTCLNLYSHGERPDQDCLRYPTDHCSIQVFFGPLFSLSTHSQTQTYDVHRQIISQIITLLVSIFEPCQQCTVVYAGRSSQKFSINRFIHGNRDSLSQGI